MTAQMKEVVSCLKALRSDMHDAAETGAAEQLDWAIGKIEEEIANAEAGEDVRECSQRSLEYFGVALRYIPTLISLLNLFSE